MDGIQNPPIVTYSRTHTLSEEKPFDGWKKHPHSTTNKSLRWKGVEIQHFYALKNQMNGIAAGEHENIMRTFFLIQRESSIESSYFVTRLPVGLQAGKGCFTLPYFTSIHLFFQLGYHRNAVTDPLTDTVFSFLFSFLQHNYLCITV